MTTPLRVQYELESDDSWAACVESAPSHILFGQGVETIRPRVIEALGANAELHLERVEVVE